MGENLKIISKICPIERVQLFNSEITLVVKTSDIINTLLFFKNNSLCQFKILSCLSGVDYPQNPHRFSVIYDLLSLRYNNRFKIKVFVYELGAIISSVNLYSTSDWFECEVWDMFGVFFQKPSQFKKNTNRLWFSRPPSQERF